MKHWLRTECCALLALAAFCLPAQGQGQDTDAKPAAGKETASQLAGINADLAELKKQMSDLPEVRKTQDTILRMLQEAAQSQQKTALQAQKNASDLAALKDRIEALESRTPTGDAALRDRVNRLEEELRRALTDTRRSFAQPTPAATPATGQIQISNLYWTPITVVVDGFSYTLLPNEVRYLTKQAGNFNYEVLGVQANVARTLAAGETFTIRINR